MRDEKTVMQRCEDAMTLPLGSIVHDTEGTPWVFVGWMVNTAGNLPLFMRNVHGIGMGMPHRHYHCAFQETLEKRFPDVARFRHAPSLPA